MTRRKSFGSFVTAVGFLTFLGTSADAGNCGGMTTCACGDTVTSDYTMSSGLNCGGMANKNAPGLYLASNVTLDCNAFQVVGGDVSGVHGIVIDGSGGTAVTDVTVQHCAVRNYDRGFFIQDATDITVLDGTARNNLQYGIDIRDVDNSPSPAVSTENVVIRNMIVRDNGDEGIHVSGRAGVNPGHYIVGNAVVGNNCEGIYVLNIDGTSGQAGVLVDSNNVYGNGGGGGPDNCSPGAAGLYIDSSDYNRFTFNVLGYDNLQLVASSNNTFSRNIVTFAGVKLQSQSNSNSFGSQCVLGNTRTPEDAYVFDNSDNNTCTDCAALDADDHQVVAENDSDNVTFTNLRVGPSAQQQTYSQSVSGDSSVTHTLSTAGMSRSMLIFASSKRRPRELTVPTPPSADGQECCA